MRRRIFGFILNATLANNSTSIATWSVRVLRTGRIWPFCPPGKALPGVVGEGVHGAMIGRARGGRNNFHGGGYVRVTGLTTIFRCVTFEALFLGEKVW